MEQGRRPTLQIEVIQFSDAVGKFLVAVADKYRSHPNSFKRIKTSLSSALVFFAKTPVSLTYTREGSDKAHLRVEGVDGLSFEQDYPVTIKGAAPCPRRSAGPACNRIVPVSGLDPNEKLLAVHPKEHKPVDSQGESAEDCGLQRGSQDIQSRCP